jgi:hypothetical protein
VVLHVSASHGLLLNVMRRDQLEDEVDQLDTREAAGLLDLEPRRGVRGSRVEVGPESPTDIDGLVQNPNDVAGLTQRLSPGSS